MRASRQSTQFSINARISRLSAVLRAMKRSPVIAGLVPAIHVSMVAILQDVDARDKRGHDDREAERQDMPRLAGKLRLSPAAPRASAGITRKRSLPRARV